MCSSHHSHRRTEPPLHHRVAAILLVALVATAVTLRPANAATLQALFQGASMTSGITKFNGWQLLSLDYTGATAPDLSQVLVVPHTGDLARPFLEFRGAGQLAAAGINSLDLSFRYRVSVIPGSETFTSHMLELANIASNGGGVAYVSSEIVTEPASSLGTTLVYVDYEQDISQLASSASFAPISQVFVVTNIFLSGLASNDSVNLMTFTTQFNQTGPLSIRGDYNQNGSVDAADYAVWRDNVDTTNALPNDFVGGTIGTGQYTQWRSHFGESWTAVVGASSGLDIASSAVPEPAAIIVLIAGAPAILVRRRRA